jgi:hypothetical protein
MGENDDEEDDDDDDEGNVVAPPALAAVPEEIIEEEALVEMVPKQEASVAHEVILADAEPEPPQPHLFNMIRRDYECDRTPLKKQGVCLPRSYQGILDEARMRKHTHKHTIP